MYRHIGIVASGALCSFLMMDFRVTGVAYWTPVLFAMCVSPEGGAIPVFLGCAMASAFFRTGAWGYFALCVIVLITQFARIPEDAKSDAAVHK